MHRILMFWLHAVDAVTTIPYSTVDFRFQSLYYKSYVPLRRGIALTLEGKVHCKGLGSRLSRSRLQYTVPFTIHHSAVSD